MADLVTALGLLLVIEGLLLALIPDSLKRMMIQVLAQPLSVLRPAGVLTAAVGVVIVWLVRG